MARGWRRCCEVLVKTQIPGFGDTTWFDLSTTLLIVAYMALVVAETDAPDDPTDFYYWAEVVFMGLFVLELVIRFAVEGIWPSPEKDTFFFTEPPKDPPDGCCETMNTWRLRVRTMNTFDFVVVVL